jgi:large subunit ribosomal protein L27
MKVNKRRLAHLLFMSHRPPFCNGQPAKALEPRTVFCYYVADMASTKAKGSSKNGRDSQSKRLGVKIFGGETVKSGMIIVRQRGSKYYVGENVRLAGDDTIFALKDGVVAFQSRKVSSHTGHKSGKTFVHVR